MATEDCTELWEIREFSVTWNPVALNTFMYTASITFSWKWQIQFLLDTVIARGLIVEPRWEKLVIQSNTTKRNNMFLVVILHTSWYDEIDWMDLMQVRFNSFTLQTINKNETWLSDLACQFCGCFLVFVSFSWPQYCSLNCHLGGRESIPHWSRWCGMQSRWPLSSRWIFGNYP